MEYLIRFAQAHESFRRPEIEALASLADIDLEFLHYDKFSPYSIVKLPNAQAAHTLITRSILARDIYELWGQGSTYDELHVSNRTRTSHLWPIYQQSTFRFTVEEFAGKHSLAEKREIIQSFAYMDFRGGIRMKDPQEHFFVFEDYVSDKEAPGLTRNTREAGGQELARPKMIWFGRWVAHGSRELVNRYDLKKRRYISTTSMDAELSLVTANIAHATPGKIFYDPFVGTGSFCVAAAHFGAVTLGSDIDPRSFKGRDPETGKSIQTKGKDGVIMGLLSNFEQYGTVSRFGDAFTSDLTNTPMRLCQWLDGIVCDPPYGVREGLRVLGTRDGRGKEEILIDGVPAHYLPNYIAPKRPYGFEAMLNDILNFASQTLVTNGRLCMWMPRAHDEIELQVPMHPTLELVSFPVQPFYNWSRRLITYRRLPEGQYSDVSLGRQKDDAQGVYADDLNEFRRKYFTKKQEKKAPKSECQPEAPCDE